MADGTIVLTTTEPLFKKQSYSTTVSVTASSTKDQEFVVDDILGYKFIGLCGFDLNQPLTLYRLLSYPDTNTIYIGVRNRTTGAKSTTIKVDALYMRL